MRRLLLLLFVCLCTQALVAQESNVFYKAPDPDDTVAHTDSIPAFTVPCFGFYFMPASTFNNGTAVAPPQDINQISVAITNSSSYNVSAPEKAGFGFSFGLFYESKPFWKRFFYGISLELLETKYTGKATLVTTSLNTAYNSTQDISYTWSTYGVNTPVGLHFAFVQTKKCRLDIGVSAAPGIFIVESHNGDKGQPNFDAFHNFTAWGTGDLGFEYFVGGSFILRAEPCYSYNFFHSDHNRRLNILGIKIGVIVK